MEQQIELKEAKIVKQRIEDEKKYIQQKLIQVNSSSQQYESNIQRLEETNQELKEAVKRLEGVNKEMKVNNVELKDELWNAIEKWHSIEKDLEYHYMSGDEQVTVLKDLKVKLEVMKNENIVMEKRMKEDQAVAEAKRQQAESEIRRAKEAKEAAERIRDELERNSPGKRSRGNASPTRSPTKVSAGHSPEKRRDSRRASIKMEKPESNDNKRHSGEGETTATKIQMYKQVPIREHNEHLESSSDNESLDEDVFEMESNVGTKGNRILFDKKPSLDLGSPYISPPKDQKAKFVRKKPSLGFQRFQTMRMDFKPDDRIILETDSERGSNNYRRKEFAVAGVQTDITIANMMQMLIAEFEAY